MQSLPMQLALRLKILQAMIVEGTWDPFYAIAMFSIRAADTLRKQQ